MRNLSVELRRPLQIFFRHRAWFFQAVLLLVLGSILFAWLQTPVYRATVQLSIDTRDQERTTIRENTAVTLPSDQERDAILNTHTKLMESVLLCAEAIQSLKASDPTITELLPKLSQRSFLQANVVPETNIIAMSADANNAQRAMRMANAAATIYTAKNLLALQGKARNERIFIEKQLAITDKELAALEERLKLFRIHSNVVSLDTQKSELLNLLSEAVKLRAQLEQEVLAQDSRSRALSKAMNPRTRAALLTAHIVSDPALNRLRESYASAQADAIALRLKYPPTNPGRMQAERKVRDFYQLLQREVKRGMASPALRGLPRGSNATGVGSTNIQEVYWSEQLLTDLRRAAAAAPLSSLDQTIATYQRQLIEFPSKEIALNRLQRELDTATQRYRTLSQKHADVALQEAAQFNNLQIVEPARYPKRPIWPNYLIITVIALLAGSLLGIGLIFLVHYLDETIYDEDMGAIFKNLPQMSIIPWYHVPDRAFSPLDAFTVFPVIPPANIHVATSSLSSGGDGAQDATLTLEAYRTLRANLRILDPNPDAHKIIAMIGATDMEGRASIVAGAAASFALTGERTLVLDTNFRGSTLTRIMHLPNEHGLSDVIIGQADWRSVIHTIKCGFVEGFSDLDIITSGAAPLYPTELLESDEMKMLLQELKQDYERIIIHTPSLLTAVDGLIIASMADINLLVVGSKRVNRRDITQLKQYLDIAKIEPMGYIIKMFEEEANTSWLPRLRPSGA